MADRTNINFWLDLEREPTQDELDAVRGIVNEHAPIDEEISCHHIADKGIWSVGGFYFEGVPDEADRIADALNNRFPDAAEIRCWDDPKYEFLGTVTVYRRGEHVLSASCDSEGTVVVYQHDLVTLIQQTDDRDSLVRRMYEAIGMEPATS